VPNNHLTRRDFLQKSTAAAALGATTGCFASARDAQANAAPVQRFRIGQVGCGGMGSIDAGSHGIGGNVVALCDVDIKQAERLNARDARISRHSPLICSDYRRILERDDIDVVSIGTTDHWHVKIAVESLTAGKHVFCQKPLALTVEENQLISGVGAIVGDLAVHTERDRQIEVAAGGTLGAQRCSDNGGRFPCDQFVARPFENGRSAAVEIDAQGPIILVLRDPLDER
jgi:hypothetical protein